MNAFGIAASTIRPAGHVVIRHICTATHELPLNGATELGYPVLKCWRFHCQRRPAATRRYSKHSTYEIT
jgi:hypothetical protein